MTAAETKRAEEVFCEALDVVDAGAREAFLEHECADNPVLRDVVRQWLSSHERVEDFFGGSDPVFLPAFETLRNFAQQTDLDACDGAGSEALVAETEGSQVGPYKLLQKLGEGGCGVVYMAEQERPVRRQVALKIIKLGMDTRHVIARFKAEQQALALMEHPNIAKVFDAGSTATGRPYFVMELVHGVKLTDYCDEHQLDMAARLELFIQVCNAVQHAHQKGIIHRDLKPSNILVAWHDGVPLPKVIDFGIAKATAGRLGDNTFFTARDQFIGTPAYMSPEQAEMSTLDVDTRSDVYSLGVLLYELLTGRTPFDQEQLIHSGMDAMRRTLRETEPRPPSTLLMTLRGQTATAKRYRTDSRKLISMVRGDLDWIAMKAMEKDRQRRYETANALAMDVRRYLNQEAVLARPPSRLYRMRKLVQRNKVTFLAGGAVAAALVAGFGTSTWLFFKERDAHLEQARLRRLAENRQKLTQATVLLDEGKFDEADRLMSEVPESEATLEFAVAYRTLGGWNAIRRDWVKACARFAVLERMAPTSLAEGTLDCLRYAPVLVMAEDRPGFDRLRRATIARYANTNDPIFAERIVRTACMVSCDNQTMKSLQPLAALAEASLSPDGKTNDPGFDAWRAISVALLKYRQHDYAGTLAMCDRALAYKCTNVPLNNSIDSLKAMAHSKLGQVSEAQVDFERSRPVIQDHRDSGFNFYWFDWLFAEILFREAKLLIEG